MFIVPLIIVISVSISNENDILQHGFSLIPRKIDFTAYEIIFKDFTIIGRAIVLTACIAIITPACICVVNSLMGYALSKDQFRLRKPITYILVASMLFSGGTVPTYIVYTQLYHFGNNILVYILPTLGSAWGVILYRTFFKNISTSLFESAYIDGANEIQILIRIVFPMAKAIFAIQYFMGMTAQWNNFQTALLYMSDQRLHTIQLVLQRILNSADVLKKAYETFGFEMDIDIPIMAMRYAICLISILPIMALFPFVQKHFSKGMAVGSVKG
jgi:putative aldouronate transport system permease protein